MIKKIKYEFKGDVGYIINPPCGCKHKILPACKGKWSVCSFFIDQDVKTQTITCGYREGVKNEEV